MILGKNIVYNRQYSNHYLNDNIVQKIINNEVHEKEKEKLDYEVKNFITRKFHVRNV